MDYAWVIMSYSICETALTPVVTPMMDILPYTASFLVMVAVFVIGGTLYACAGEVWMVIVARSFMGIGALLSSALIYTYIGEMGTVMDKIRVKKGKRPLKQFMYTITMFTSVGVNALLSGEESQ